MIATVRIKKVCDTADKKWTGSNSGLVVGTAFVIPIPRVPVVPPVTTIPKLDMDAGNFSFPSLPKIPSARDLANGIVGWFIGDYIQKLAKEVPGLPKQGAVDGDIKNAPSVDAGKQGKHVPWHNNSIDTKTQWKKGQTGVNETQEGWVKGKLLNDGTKVWDAGKVIGPNGETGVRVHIDGAGRIHGYPVDPKQYLK